MPKSSMGTALIFAAVAFFSGAPILSSSSAAELRPVAPVWQEIAISQEGAATVVRSRAGSETITLRFGGQVKVLQKDRPYLASDSLKIWLDRSALADAFRGKPADEVLATYRDYVNADLKRREWRELTAERMTIAAGGNAPAIYWVSQADVRSKGKPLTLTMSMAAALVGANIVAVTGIAEDAQGPGVLKRYLAETLATLETKAAAELSGEDIAQLRRAAQEGSRRGVPTGVMLVNDKLASGEDREKVASERDRLAGGGGIQRFVLSPSDLIEAVALGVAGSRGGSFMAFLNDGQSQHTISIEDYDPSTETFTYYDPKGSRGLLASGNNVAGVEAVRGPCGWRVKKDQLQTVLSAIILGKAETAKASGKAHLGPFGDLGNTLDDAKQTDFFKWFGLAETGRSATPDGGTTISFGPGSDKYRPLVTVRLDLAPAGWIRGADIVLKRRLIDSDKTSEEANARDIAKSFIASCVTAGDEKQTRGLRDEIFHLVSGQVLVAAGKDMSVPPIPTDGYLTFTGRREYFMDYLSRSRLWTENIVADGEPALLISIGPAS
jgi:hypothetical protein